MYAIVLEPRITLDPRLFCEDVIVFTFEIFNDFRETGRA